MIGKAYAKINLCLDVTGKRKDGYHELNTIMQTVDLYDVLSFRIQKAGEKRIVITSNLPYLPVDKRNLVVQSADLFMQWTGLCLDVSVHLEKNIPVAAGLGGGSADAGLTLRVLNEWANHPIDLRSLSEKSKAIGADVPFAVYGGTALVTGIGEYVQPIHMKEDLWLVLVTPNISVSTKTVFQKFVLEQSVNGEQVNRAVQALEFGNPRVLGQNLFNKLESVTIKDYPLIGSIKELLMNNGALGSVMSGSGPSVFGLFSNPEKAQAALKCVTDQMGSICRAFCVKTVRRSIV